MSRRAANKIQAQDTHKAVAYVRVSTDEQNLGPDAQRRAMADWAGRNGVEIVATFEDHGVSGAAELDKRPGLLSAVDALAANGAGLLVVAKRDRLARDVVAAAMIERLAERSGARIVSAAGEGTENSDPASILMRTMIDAFAQYERAIIRARTKAALAVKKANGERTGSVPYGYHLAADGKTLETDLDEQAALSAIVEYRSEGLTLAAIGERLAARGIRPRTGSKWHPQTLSRILERAA